MRIWTLHPRYLDPAGLVALWRETLLAQAVLEGKTRGYRHHPQLIRFQKLSDPVAGVASYLEAVHAEAVARGYNFDKSKISRRRHDEKIPETRGQLLFEWEHLGRKLMKRNPAWHKAHFADMKPSTHPLFRTVAGGVRDWEKTLP
jgi:hypothetical protein